MGTATAIIYHVGGMMAGFGANVVAQSVVINIGYATTKNKFVRACVTCASMAAGGFFWTRAEEAWHDEVAMADEAFKDLAKGLSSFVDNSKKEENVIDGE